MNEYLLVVWTYQMSTIFTYFTFSLSFSSSSFLLLFTFRMTTVSPSSSSRLTKITNSSRNVTGKKYKLTVK